jgi:hypothetical protein
MSECACVNSESWTPKCLHWNTCPGRRDGGHFPLLPMLWGGLAADHGIYRSMIGSDVFFEGGAAPSWKSWPQPPAADLRTPFDWMEAHVSLPVGPVQS